jgi:pentatricopeptide repeat domain-containing protein 1
MLKGHATNNIVTLLIFIIACAKAGLWRKALELLDEMEDNGVKPNEVSYSVCISACGNGGQWEKALELLYLMREKSMNINLITYNAAITALSKASKRSAKSRDKQMAAEQYAPDAANNDKSSSTMVKDGTDDQLWEKALDLLDQMRADGIEPDGFSFSAAISCCGAGGRWEEALTLIKTMKKGGPKTRPNRVSYTAAIGKFLQCVCCISPQTAADTFASPHLSTQ